MNMDKEPKQELIDKVAEYLDRYILPFNDSKEIAEGVVDIITDTEERGYED
jgi:hypothetical protein